MYRKLIFTFLAILLLIEIGRAQIPKTMSYQGILKDNSGNVVADGTYDIDFNLYDVADGGISLWSEFHANVPVTHGVFSVPLGDTDPLNLDFNTQYWLKLTLDGTDMSPRIPLTASPYSLSAQSVAGANNVFPSTGSIGVGTTTPGVDGIHISGNTGVTELMISQTNRGVNSKLTAAEWTGPGEGDGGVVGTTSNHPFGIVTANELRMAITSDGKVGIGTDSPWDHLTVAGNMGVGGAGFGASGGVSGQGIAFPAGPDDVHMIYGEHDGGDQSNLIIEQQDNNDDAVIFRNLGVYEADPVDYLRIARDGIWYNGEGNVGIGTDNPTNILTIAQDSPTDPIADAWTTYSSRRWKTNIRPIGNALEKVQQLRGVTFDWKADGRHDIGLIAEEVGNVIPEVVAYEDNGRDARSVDYARLVALLIEGMKAQQQEIQELQAAVESLEAQFLVDQQ